MPLSKCHLEMWKESVAVVSLIDFFQYNVNLFGAGLMRCLRPKLEHLLNARLRTES